MMSPEGFDLGSIATPMQRAMWRIADGLTDFSDLYALDPALEGWLAKACGPNDGLHKLPTEPPKEFYLLSGIRTLKSGTAAGIALKNALTCDLSMLLPWEDAVVSILSIKLSKARKVLSHLLGPLKARPKLRRLIVGKPTRDCVRIRRPQDGRIIRFEVVAAAVAGGGLVSDWSAGVVFDEFARMDGEDDGAAINFDEQRKAVLGRLVPGAQLVAVSSPYAPRGPAWDAVQGYWGAPSAELVVVRPFARMMNPAYWTDARIAKLRKSPKGAWVYQTDYLGEFADPINAFFAVAELVAVTRKAPWDTPRNPAGQYFATIDPAKRRNAWTLCIGCRLYLPNVDDGSFLVQVALVRQWLPQPDKPLDPKVVFQEIAKLCAPFGVTEVFTDQWKHAELEIHANAAHLVLTDYELAGNDSAEMYDAFRLRVLSRGIELHPDPELQADLLAVRKLVRRSKVTMDLPVTGDGRHCDYAPAIVLLNEVASRAPSLAHAMKVLEEHGGRLL
jgi:hypothetical protein